MEFILSPCGEDRIVDLCSESIDAKMAVQQTGQFSTGACIAAHWFAHMLWMEFD